MPPSAYGTYLGANDDGTVDIFTAGRKMRVSVHPEVDVDAIVRGQEVALNESFNVVLARSAEISGEVVILKEILESKDRALIVGRADEERVCELGASLLGEKLRAGDHLLMDGRSGLLVERIPRPEVEELVLEEVPDVTYDDVGGLDDQIDAIKDAVELPYLYSEMFHEHELQPPEGHPALRPAGLRQDAHRQGGRQLARAACERAHRRHHRPVVLPQHQGPRAPQQVRGGDRAPDPADLPAGAREVGGGLPGHRVLRRDGLAVPHARHRHLLRHREHDRAAAPRRDRRRRGAEERHRHRCVEPGRPHRPRHPAAGPPRREDQDRAPRRGERHQDLPPVPRPDAAHRRRRDRPASAVPRRRSRG